MLKFAKRQMKVIDTEVEAAYAREMAAYLRMEHAEDVAALSEDKLYTRVSIAIQRASRYDMTWDTSITAYVAIMFTISPTFDEQPAIRAVMNDESVPPNLRIDALWDRTTDDDWDEAERSAEGAEESFWPKAEAAIQEATQSSLLN